MKALRTKLDNYPVKPLIVLTDKILTIGSCFSDAIGSRFITNKISTLANPFGVLFNPHSIHKVIQYATLNQPVLLNTYVKRDDVFFNYDFHSELSSLNLKHLQERLDKAIDTTHRFLKEARWIIITYGTAWVYQRLDTKEVVANCHKVPQEMFTKSLLTQKKVLESFDMMYQDLKNFNSEINILLTVSPVRHLKDTLELNSVSKSVLRMACHTLTQQYKDVTYFPSFEIMMDDLRDYRFYKADMIHPSELAEEYIWEKFGERYFDEALKKFVVQWKEIQSALAHKPFHPASAAHQHFLAGTIKKLEELKTVVNVEQEIAEVVKQLI